MTHLIPADFHGESIQIIEKDGARWLTARDLGLCLGYSLGNASKGILKVYERHLDEFTAEDSTTVKLTAVDGKERNVRIFSPSGCHLISFFANTHRAKTFRAWAKQVLVDVSQSQRLQQSNIAALQQEALKKPAWRAILRYKRMGLNHREIAACLGWHPVTVSKHVRRMEACGLLNPPKALPKQQQLALQFFGGAS